MKIAYTKHTQVPSTNTHTHSFINSPQPVRLTCTHSSSAQEVKVNRLQPVRIRQYIHDCVLVYTCGAIAKKGAQPFDQKSCFEITDTCIQDNCEHAMTIKAYCSSMVGTRASIGLKQSPTDLISKLRTRLSSGGKFSTLE